MRTCTGVVLAVLARVPGAAAAGARERWLRALRSATTWTARRAAFRTLAKAAV